MLLSLLLASSAGFSPLAPSCAGRMAGALRANRIMAASPSPPPAIDLRRPGGPAPAPGSADKYGHDPRDGLSGDDLKPDSSFASSIAPGTVVETLGTVGQLQAALDTAGDKQVVVIKFVREGCLACASTMESYRATAKAVRVYFFEPDDRLLGPFSNDAMKYSSK